MADIKFKNLDKYVAQIEKLNFYADTYIKDAVYAGGNVVADATKEALIALNPDNSPSTVEHRRTINAKQKAGLIESFGLAPVRNDKGFINVKTGFDGYNEVITKRWPLGQPNAMIARAMESGTSFMDKNPIIRKATNRAKKPCEEAMRLSFENSIKKLMK